MTTLPVIKHPDAAQVLDFWLSDGLTLGWPSRSMNKRWFQGGATLDQVITTRFGTLVEQALAGSFSAWASGLPGRLALVILLDQFARHVFRGQARAFEGDAHSVKLVLRMLAQREDLQLPAVGRVFLYMPLMHAESVILQQECVARFSQLLAEVPASLRKSLQGSLDAAREHRDIIARYGRFPHRNKALGRLDTAEETLFLVRGPRFGQ